ncbi:phosphatase PAP2 family protein [Falsiroseomonas bella]|uniref:phosphatase PAP2 family protein n=1 Tax=Falsiroseomonas bella TaxID=2184016 RepID=UPI0011B8496C|nr:phosphatase PAP2 family protein [Falsiroseomonas bella]
MDLPFVAEPATAAWTRISDGEYRAGHEGRFGRRWSGGWRAWHVLAEFTDGEAWRNRQRRSGEPAAGEGGLAILGWRQRLPKGGKSLRQAVDDEIDELIRLAEDERADAMGEIVTQSDEFISQFMGVLCARPASHPATFAALTSASMVAALAVQHFKMLEDRPRPSQVCAALRPAIEVPGHAAYPSGHATQAFLMAHVARAVLQGSPWEKAQEAVDALAARIARNREIAGVHYRSDTEVGRELAEALRKALVAVPLARAQVKAAREEWAEQ